MKKAYQIKNIILITGDDKPDWWSVSKGKTLGPRVELIKEFENKTGHKFYMYTAHNFLSISSKEIGGTSDEAAVEEMRNTLNKASIKIKNSFLSKQENLDNYSGRAFSGFEKVEDLFDFELGMEDEVIVEDENDSGYSLRVKLADLKNKFDSVEARLNKYERDYKKLKDYDELFGLDDNEREKFLYLTNLLRELRDELSNNIFFTQIELDGFVMNNLK